MDGEEELQENFDPERYQGLWYDVARFPKFFDRNTPWQTAEYTLKTDDRGDYIEVHNTAYYEDGTVKKDIDGTARPVDPNEPAALYVSFPNIFSVLFGDPDRANYLVHATDYDTYAVVGSYDRRSLYILARERPITMEKYEELLEYVTELEYDVNNLQEDYGSVDRPAKSIDRTKRAPHQEEEDICVIS